MLITQMERMSQGKDDDNVIQVTFGEMTWNGFFTFPFPPISTQSIFLPIPISKFKSYSHFREVPIGLLPFPSHPQTRTA